MKLKRIFCLLLSLLILVSLVACAPQNGTDSINPSESAIPSVSDDTQPISSNEKLVFYDYAIPTIEDFAYYHEEYNGTDRAFTETCFDFTLVDMYSALQNSSFFGHENGRNLKMFTSENAAYYHPDYPMYDFSNEVYCELGGTEENPDMTITVSQLMQSTYFKNPNAICLTITYNPEAEGYIRKIQDYPYEILNTLVDWEFANFVVYGNDTDGLDYYADGYILPSDLSENADAGNGGYMFCRTFEENKVIYEIFFHEDNARADQELIGRPVDNVTYDLLPYKLDFVLSDNFGGKNPSDIYNFGNKLFTSIDSEYKTVLISSVRHSKLIDNSGFAYDVGCTVEVPGTWNMLDFIASYTISEDKIIDSDVSWYLSIDRTPGAEFIQDASESKKAVQKDINRFINIAKNVLPDSEITFVGDFDNNDYTYRIDYTYFEEQHSKIFEVTYGIDFIETYVLPDGVDHIHSDSCEHGH